MQSTLEALLHDAASLHAFVRFVARFCEECRASQTYLDSSDFFLDYVHQLAAQTLPYLQPSVDQARGSSRLAEALPRRLVSLKDCWCVLHEFLKPASEASTLNVPVPLLELVRRMLRSLPALKDARVVLLLSSDLNYLQYRHGRLRSLVDELRRVIPAAPALPKGLGFIAIPYSQRSRLFTNLLIYHEMGHFVFEELSLDQHLSSLADRSLKATLGPDFSAATRDTQLLCRRQILTWSEEIFCDLFALWLVGPAYSFASIELFNLLALFAIQSDVEFSTSHPALACRFNEHFALLKSLGWWDAIGYSRSAHLGLIKKLAAIPQRRYAFPMPENPQLGRLLLKAFLPIRLSVRKLVAQTLGDQSTGLRDFLRCNRAIEQCLSHGVVPSSLVIQRRLVHPRPVAVINSAFCFYLESLPVLMRNTVEYRQDRLKDRAALAERVEMWAMKAIEDYHLLTGQLED